LGCGDGIIRNRLIACGDGFAGAVAVMAYGDGHAGGPSDLLFGAVAGIGHSLPAWYTYAYQLV